MSKYNIPSWNSIDNLTNEQFTVYASKIKKLEMKYKHFKILNKIPHLQLDLPEFDYETAKQQIQNATNDIFVPINMRNYYDTVANGPSDHPYWSARALINYSNHSDRFFGNRDKEFATLSMPEMQPNAKRLLEQNEELTLEDMIYYRTDIYDSLPYITEYINNYICDRSYRIYLWKLKAKGTIEWHNHSNLTWNKNLEVNESILVHIPIITNPLVEMLVKIKDKVYSEYYKPGNVYIFNNNYDHGVINDSETDRLHVIVMIPWSDNKIAKLIEKTTMKESYE
jgi:hypothetical protein